MHARLTHSRTHAYMHANLPAFPPNGQLLTQVRDALTGSLNEAKHLAAGAFGVSRLEARLDVCLPAIVSAFSGIARFVQAKATG